MEVGAFGEGVALPRVEKVAVIQGAVAVSRQVVVQEGMAVEKEEEEGAFSPVGLGLPEGNLGDIQVVLDNTLVDSLADSLVDSQVALPDNLVDNLVDMPVVAWAVVMVVAKEVVVDRVSEAEEGVSKLEALALEELVGDKVFEEALVALAQGALAVEAVPDHNRGDSRVDLTHNLVDNLVDTWVGVSAAAVVERLEVEAALR